MSDSAIEQEVDSESDALLSRGYVLLRRLQLKQQAVEIQAAALELQQALGSAEQGKCDELLELLKQHESLGVSSPWSHPRSTSQVTTYSSDDPKEPLVRGQFSKRCSTETADGESSTLETRPSLDDNPLNADQPQASPWDRLIEALEESQKPESQKPELKVDPKLEAVLNRLSLPSDQTNGSVPRKLRSIPSWVISLAVHVVLLVVLGIVTIQSLDESKIFSIQASSAESETVVFEAISELEPQEVETEPIESPDSSPAFESMAMLSEPSLTSIHEASVALEAGAVIGSAAESVNAASRGSGARGASAQFFGAEAAGNTFCFIVDSSGSMRKGGAFEAAKRELLRSISALKPSQRFYIYFFSDEVEMLRLGEKEPEKFPVYATPENVQMAAEWVSGIQIRGGRAPNDAFDLAIELEPDAIFLLFDGNTKVDVAAHLRKVNRVDDLLSGPIPRVSIHTIGFGDRQHEPLMAKIAAENLGTYRFVPLSNTAKN